MNKLEKIAKAIAFVVWADNKVEQSELDCAAKIFAKYGLDEKAGLAAVKTEIDNFIDLKEEEIGDDEVIESPLDLGDISSDEYDSFELLEDLADIVLADGVLETNEVGMIHLIGKAMNLEPELVTAALLKAAAKKENLKININVEVEEE
jgi:uncharacterized tellurite resistance protein B-like protein